MAEFKIQGNTYLILVKLNEEGRANASALVKTIKEVDDDYMGRFGTGKGFPDTRFHAALIGPYDFAILYSGSIEAAIYLAAKIGERKLGETLTMPAMDLDQFSALFGG